MERIRRNGLRLSVVVAQLLLLALMAVSVSAADKPRLAVLEFKAKADNQWYHWWSDQGASAAQDVFVTELVKTGQFRVVERERLDALIAEQDLSLSGDVDSNTAVQAGKLLGVKYFLTGAITEYGTKETSGSSSGVGGLPSFGFKSKKFTAAMNARIIDTETGEIIWADEASNSAKATKVRVAGTGGGTDSNAMFDKVLKPTVQDLVQSIKAADL